VRSQIELSFNEWGDKIVKAIQDLNRDREADDSAAMGILTKIQTNTLRANR
jgi:hypothetical protein